MNSVNSNLQTGITVIDNMSHHKSSSARASKEHTVDGDGNTLGQYISISTFERRNPSKRIDLQVLVWNAFRRLGVDDFKVELVGLGNCSNRSGSGVAL